MDKNFYSLEGEGSCLIKEFVKNSKPYIQVSVSNAPKLSENEIFKLYKKGNEGYDIIGSLEGTKGVFEGKYKAGDLVVMRKNLLTGKSSVEFGESRRLEWQKICGYYSPCRYRAFLAVLAEIKDKIRENGGYYAGSRGSSITAAVRADENPFGRMKKYAWRININGEGCYAVTVGKDEKGEYFVIK